MGSNERGDLGGELGAVGPRAGQEGNQKLQNREEELAITVRHRGNEAVGPLGSHVTTVVTRSEVNEVAFRQVVECINGGQLPSPQGVASYLCQEGLGAKRGRGRGGGDNRRGKAD